MTSRLTPTSSTLYLIHLEQNISGLLISTWYVSTTGSRYFYSWFQIWLCARLKLLTTHFQRTDLIARTWKYGNPTLKCCWSVVIGPLMWRSSRVLIGSELWNCMRCAISRTFSAILVHPKHDSLTTASTRHRINVQMDASCIDSVVDCSYQRQMWQKLGSSKTNNNNNR